MENENTIYDKIEEGHDYNALISGNATQRFWQRNKFVSVINKVDFSKKVLDVGCGPGVLFYLANPSGRAVGIDNAGKQIIFAKKLNKNAEFFEGDAKNLPFNNKEFDYVTSVEVIEHINKDDAGLMLDEIRRVLKDDGKMIITTPNYHSFWPVIEFIWSRINPIDYSKEHINKQTFKKLENLLKEHKFRVVNMHSFFILSPFLNFISKNLAEKMHALEIKILPRLGSIILVEAVKDDGKV